MTEPKKVDINPDSALRFVDEVCAKFEGTRDDHKVLDKSVEILRNVVNEWKLLKDAMKRIEIKEPEPEPEPKPRSNGKTRTRKRS